MRTYMNFNVNVTFRDKVLTEDECIEFFRSSKIYQDLCHAATYSLDNNLCNKDYFEYTLEGYTVIWRRVITCESCRKDLSYFGQVDYKTLCRDCYLKNLNLS